MKNTVLLKIALIFALFSMVNTIRAFNNLNTIDTSCNETGTVFESNFWWYIVIDNNLIIEPIDSLPQNVRKDSTRVRLSYMIDVTDSIGNIGKRAYITCIVPDTLPPSCKVDFHYNPIRCQPWMSSIRCGMYNYRFEMETTDSVVYWAWIKDGNDTNFAYSPIYVFNDSGSYTICLQVIYQNGCVANHCEAISFPPDQQCKADFIYYPLDILTNEKKEMGNDLFYPVPYPNNTYEFVDMSIGDVVSWEWKFDNDTVYYEQNIVYTFDKPGLHSVCLSIQTKDSCTSTTCMNVFIDTIPECKAYFWYYQSNYYYDWKENVNQIIFLPDTIGNDTIPNDTTNYKTVYFYDYSYGNITSWLWDFGDSTGSTERNPVHTYKGFGKYEVCLYIKSDTGCEDTHCMIVNVFEPEECKANFEYCKYNPNDSIDNNAKGYIIGFKDLSQGNIYSWYWNFGDGSYGYEQNPVHKYNYPGVYNVCLSVYGNNGCYDYYCASVVVGDGCNIDFSWNVAYPNCIGYMPAYSFNITNRDSVLYTYWNFGDGDYSYETEPVHIFDYAGSYNVCLTVQKYNGCNAVICKNVDVIYEHIDSLYLKNCGTSIADRLKNEKSFNVNNVFPNPVDDKLTFSIESSVNRNITIRIINTMGMEVITNEYNLIGGTNEVEANLELLPQGNYIYLINTGEEVSRGMILKK